MGDEARGRHPGGFALPNWFVPLICLIGLAGFIGFAFRQGTRVTPDRDNRDNWPGGSGDQSHSDGSHHGFDGHS
jgi:hypothetical protein